MRYFLLLAVILAGCVTRPDPTANMTSEQKAKYAQDDYRCEKEATFPTVPMTQVNVGDSSLGQAFVAGMRAGMRNGFDKRLYRKCMKAAGWRE